MDAKELIGLKRAYEKAVSVHGKKVLAQLFKEFFESAPEVIAVTWVQYTPHFNDGDACTFGVHEFEYVLASREQTAKKGKDADEDDEDVEGVHSYDFQDELKAATDSLEEQTSNLDDLFLEAFDDHVKVIAKPNGKFETQEFSHD